jgi:hypothetical protein
LTSSLWTDNEGRISRIDLGPLGRDSLQAIERPACDVGVHVEPQLVSRLLKLDNGELTDVFSGPGNAPPLDDGQPLAYTGLVKVAWDEAKNIANRRKHGVTFEEAKELFTSGIDYEIDDGHSGADPATVCQGDPISRSEAPHARPVRFR